MKAITPVIATIVLLLITVAIAGSAWTYISGYWTGTTGKQIEVVDAFCVGTDQAKVLLKNIGTDALNTGEITIMDKGTGNDITDNARWAGEVADSSLVLDLKFDEGTGAVAADSSGTGNNGLLMPSGSGPAWIGGKSGTALHYDGINDRVNCGNGTGLQFGTSDISISFWIRTDPAGPLSTIISKSDMEGRFWVVDDAAGGTMSINCYFGPGKDYWRSGTVNLDDGKWHHIAATFDRDGFERLYVDGSLDAERDISGASSNSWNASYNIWISGGIYNFFLGDLDELRIYNRLLSQGEVAAIADNAIAIGPGEVGTMMYTCSGRCDYRVLLGGMSRTVSVQC